MNSDEFLATRCHRTEDPTSFPTNVLPSRYVAIMNSLSRGPWIDLHAHPGRCFLEGNTPESPWRALLGDSVCGEVLKNVPTPPFAAISVSSVSDLAVLGVTPDGGLAAVRPFEEGEAYRDHRRQVDGVVSMLATERIALARCAADLTRAHESGELVAILSCEGADFAESLFDSVFELRDLGVRIVTLVHYRANAFADPQTEPERHGGLSDDGRRLVHALNHQNILIDLAHATLATTRDVLEISTAPIVISHTHLQPRNADHARLISREHARIVADAGGLIGAWPSGLTSTTLDDFVSEVLRLVDTVGVEHVAVGTDMDANYRPVLDHYDQFGDVNDRLVARGLHQHEVERILGTNVLELFRAVCG